MPGRAAHPSRRAGVDLEKLAKYRGFAERLRAPERLPGWEREQLSGRLTELSGSSALTAAAGLVLEAQVGAEPCAWVTRKESTFFPPDLARSGIDLDALAVVFVSSASEAARSASRLVRSGAFGLVVLDLGRSPPVATPLEGRLAMLAREHDAAVVVLTEKAASEPSFGSMVSLRMEARRIRKEGGARFRMRLTALKDKRRGPGWTHDEVVHGPAGLR